MTRPTAWLLLTWLTLPAAIAAPAEPRHAATLVLAECPAGTLDIAAVNALLSIELPREEILLSDTPLAGRPLTLWLRCLPDPGQLLLTAEEAHRREEHPLSLLDVAPSLRPRTLALALAELVRRMRQAPDTAPPSLSAIPTSPPSPAETPSPPTLRTPLAEPLPSRRLKVSGYTALGLAATTVATGLLGVGAVVLNSEHPNPQYRGAIAGLFTASGAALIGTATSLGLWVRERQRLRPPSHKPTRISAGIAPLRGGGGLVLTGSF
jgi:hypothetical protein